jgi:hypothetical protein
VSDVRQLANLLVGAGLTAVVAGAWWWSPPAAVIAAGVVAVGLGVGLVRTQRKEPR